MLDRFVIVQEDWEQRQEEEEEEEEFRAEDKNLRVARLSPGLWLRWGARR